MALAFLSLMAALAVAMCIVSVSGLTDTGGQRNASEVEALRNLLSSLLAVPAPRSAGGLAAPVGRAPRRLLELLEHLALAHRAPWAHGVRGVPTTVRSALPQPYGLNTSLLSFVVDIPPDEELVHAKLHLYRTPDPDAAAAATGTGPLGPLGSELPLATRLRLFHVGQGHQLRRRDLGSVPVAPAPALHPDWHAVDVTAGVRELPSGPPHPHVLAVRFESPSPSRRIRRAVIPAAAYLAPLEEVQVQAEAQPPGPPAASAFLVLLTASRATLQVDTHKIAEALLAAGAGQLDSDVASRRQLFRSRERRSIMNNELDEDLGDTIPLPTRHRSYSSKRKQTTKRNKKHEEVCRRRRLDLRFSDLGWQDWILWPDTFSAHYCGGQCPFPLTKAMKPTNHASIQSLVRALGLAGVPAPSCVPDQLEPLTLLYRDTVGAVVLRSYPNMRVVSCACR